MGARVEAWPPILVRCESPIQQSRRLCDFNVAGADYGLPVEVDVPWPVPSEAGESAGW